MPLVQTICGVAGVHGVSFGQPLWAALMTVDETLILQCSAAGIKN